MINLEILTPELLELNGIVDWGYNESPDPSTYTEFLEWSQSSHSQPLSYLQDHRAIKRKSLLNVYPDFQSSISFLFSYSPKKFDQDFKMGNYIFACDGVDYHYELRERLESIGKKLCSEYKTILDVEPVLERDLALKSGLGWFGKNSMLINRKHGSYFLIGSILFPHKAQQQIKSNIETDHCGNCTACIDQCPTEAIDPHSRTLIANKCISTFTIEIFKEHSAPDGYSEASEVFGCDICQDVCPWNRKILQDQTEFNGEKSLLIKNFFFDRKLEVVIEELENMSNREFRRLFAQTSLERTGRVGILKNLKPFLKNTRNMSRC